MKILKQCKGFQFLASLTPHHRGEQVNGNTSKRRRPPRPGPRRIRSFPTYPQPQNCRLQKSSASTTRSTIHPLYLIPLRCVSKHIKMAANMSPASDTILVDVVFVYRTHYEKRSTAEPIMISKRPQDKRTLKTCLLQKFEIMMSHPDSRLFILETIIGFELDKWMRKLRQKSVRVGLMRILWSDGLKTGLHEDNLEKAYVFRVTVPALLLHSILPCISRVDRASLSFFF